MTDTAIKTSMPPDTDTTGIGSSAQILAEWNTLRENHGIAPCSYRFDPKVDFETAPRTWRSVTDYLQLIAPPLWEKHQAWMQRHDNTK